MSTVSTSKTPTTSSTSSQSFKPFTPMELAEMITCRDQLRAPAEKVMHLICWDTLKIGCHLALTGYLKLPYYSTLSEVGKFLKEYPSLYNEVNKKLYEWGMGYQLNYSFDEYKLVLDNTSPVKRNPSDITMFARYSDVEEELESPEYKHPHYQASLLLLCTILYRCDTRQARNTGKIFFSSCSKLGKLLRNEEIYLEIVGRANEAGWVISSVPFGYLIEPDGSTK